MRFGRFFKEHSYDMVKMFLNQFAVALFGFVLTLTFTNTKIASATMRIVCSAFAILFYLFLLYYMTWEIGYRDRGKVHSGDKPQNLFRGTLISLCANAINLLVAIVIMIAQLSKDGMPGAISGVAGFLGLFLNGMYNGILMVNLFGEPMNSYWLTYFVLPLPAIIICTVAYILGFKDKKFTPLFNQAIPKSDRDSEKKYWK